MLSENLEQSLHRAMTCAADRGAELVTLEHLLFALVEDEDASELLNACSVDLNKLKSELDDFMTNTLDKQIDYKSCLLYTSPSPRDRTRSRMPSSA